MIFFVANGVGFLDSTSVPMPIANAYYDIISNMLPFHFSPLILWNILKRGIRTGH